MVFLFNAYGLLGLVASIISLTIALVIWRRRPGVSAIYFVGLMLAVALWALSSGLEILGATLAMKQFFSFWAYVGIVIIPAMWLIFVLEYTGRGRWLDGRRRWLLAIHPVVTIAVIATNPWHGLFWAEVAIDEVTAVASYVYNIAFFVHTAYAYVLLMAAAVLLISAFVRSPHLYRGQITALVVAQAIPWLANALYITQSSPLPYYVDLTPLSFTLMGMVVAWSVYRYQFMDLAPVAHHAVFASLVDAVFVLDDKGRIVDANQAASDLLSIPVSDIIGMPALLVFNQQQTLVHRFRSVETTQQEVTITLAGEERIFQLQIAPLRTSNGHLSGRILVLHDVTQLKRANRELEAARIKADESARLKSEFLATISHELRTPLSAIIGYTSLINAGMLGTVNERLVEPLVRIDHNSNYLLQLINDLLDLSRIEAGRVEIDEKPEDIAELFAGWQQQVAVLAAEKNLEFESFVAPDLPAVIQIDREKLSKIVLNLLSNAIKFTDAGQVTLRAKRASDDEWCIEVQDSGIGIPAAAQEYIFDHFRQVDGSDKREHNGTGLGLAIVRKLVVAMKGQVWVESEVGQGSTFTVKLPLHVLPQNADLPVNARIML